MSAVSDAVVDASRSILADELDELRDAIAGLSPEDLNRRPAGEGSNSLAVIVEHALASTRSWLSLATGAPLPPRDRPAEFRTVADANFPARVDHRIDECLALLGGEVAFDPTGVGTAPWRSTGADEPVTAAWALLHALSHLDQHVGHAHITRDLLRSG
jgi:uncharacterized damage-inducible protein DinB